MTSKASGIVPSWHCADLKSVTKVGGSGWQGEAARGEQDGGGCRGLGAAERRGSSASSNIVFDVDVCFSIHYFQSKVHLPKYRFSDHEEICLYFCKTKHRQKSKLKTTRYLIIAFSAPAFRLLPTVNQIPWRGEFRGQERGIREILKATVHRQRVAAQRAAQQGVLALHGQRGLRDRGLGRLRARGATRSDLPWAPTPGKKIVLTGDILLFVPQSRDTDRDCILKEHPDRDVCAAPDRPHFPGWQRERNCVPRLLALWPEQAARVQRVLRLQGNHLQPAAILNETNCKYKMSRPEATLHLY